MQNDQSKLMATSRIGSQSGRTFYAKVISFQNGCFITIDEGSGKLGSISIAISSSNKTHTAKVIPSKFDSIFIDTICQRVSSLINGICLVSLHSAKQLQFEDMRAIMDKVMTLMRGETGSGDDNKVNSEQVTKV